MNNFDLTLIENSLMQGEAAGVPGWLADSYQNPPAFWETLVQTPDPSSPLSRKSIAFKAYYFIHDALIRNRYSTTPAFRWHDGVAGWREASYAVLEADVNRKANHWRSLGAQPEQILCIIRPMGYQFSVSLLAAFKLGLIVSVLPPGGSAFLTKRLQHLEPNHIDADSAIALLLPKQRDKFLAEQPSVPVQNHLQTDADALGAYPAGAIAAQCFDPSSSTPHIPVEVTSDVLYLSALRDGIIALGLRRGDLCAAPGFHFLQTQPGLLLAVLLAGGTYLHLEPADLHKNPELLTSFSIKTLGITPQVRDMLLKHPVIPGEQWSFWFKDPAGSADYELWLDFVEALQIKDVFTGNLKWNAACGGCSLFSIKKKGVPHAHIFPAAGVQWGLSEVADPATEARGDVGLLNYRLSGVKTAIQTADMILRKPKGCQYIRSLVSGRAGIFYPREEIEAWLKSTPGCLALIELPTTNSSEVAPIFVLLNFTGGRQHVDKAGIQRSCFEIIENEIGKDFLPDQALFFPLYPRRTPDGQIDYKWCQAEHLNNRLYQKSQQELFCRLSSIRAALYQ